MIIFFQTPLTGRRVSGMRFLSVNPWWCVGLQRRKGSVWLMTWIVSEELRDQLMMMWW